MIKPIICITDFSNTQSRIVKLRNLVNSIPETYDILLISHIIPPTDIIDKCDFFIFDKKNDGIFDLKYKQYESYHTKNFSLYYHTYGSNVSWVPSILKMWSLSLSSLKSLGYNVVHLIEYDTIIHNFDLFEKNSEFLKDYDVVLYNHPFNKDKTIEWTTGNIISLNLEKVIWNKLSYHFVKIEKDFYELYTENKLPCAERIIFNTLWKDLNIKLLERDSDLKDFVEIGLSHLEKKESFPIISIYKDDENFKFFVKNKSEVLISIEFIINKIKCISFNCDANTWVLGNLEKIEDLLNLTIYLDKKLYFEFNLENEYDRWLINSSNFIKK